jgi:peroxiredoxin
MRAIFALAAFALFSVWIAWRAKSIELAFAPDREMQSLNNHPAPDFSLPSLDNKTIALADFRGRKKLVVSFWASWCGPCRLELPLLRAFYQRNHKSDSDFEFLAISIDEDRDAAEKAAKDAKLPFPVLLDTENKTSAAFHVHAIPSLFIVDRTGTIVHAEAGVSAAMSFMLAQYLGVTDKPPMMGVPPARRDH